MADAVLLGNNLAVLVAAAELGAAGREVVLATDGRPPGGHFRGLRVGDTDFDIGMVTLETLGGASAGADVGSPVDYQPDRRYDWTRFATLVDRWQEAHVELRRIPTPEVLLDARRWPDHLMTDRLDVLAALGTPPSALLPRDHPAHASHKTTGPAYDDITYSVAAESNHGADLHHRLVTPFADKVLGPLADQLLARYHRAAWLPLYWPETVVDACAGRPTAVGEHPFSTTASGSVGELVRTVEERLVAMSGVTVDDSPVRSLRPVAGGWEVATAGGGRWVHPTPVLGVAPDRARALVGLAETVRPPGAPVTVVFCLVRAAAVREPSPCLLVADPGYTTHRLTDQDAMAGRDPAWHRVVVEAGHRADALAAAGEDVSGRLVEELCRLLGIASAAVGPDGAGHPDVRVLRTLRAPGALAVPTAASVAAARSERDELVDVAPSVLLTGALLGPGLNSLGDQVVQGLGVAERLR